MASKVWDDLSMWNVDFSHVYPSVDLQRVNTLELAMLDALKYYFHLRSMIPRLGLDGGHNTNSIKPLDVAGARKLQLATEKYQEMSSDSGLPRRRHNSVYASNIERQRSDGQSTYTHSTVGLEQLIHDQHVDADGLVHKSATPTHKGGGNSSSSSASKSSGIAISPRNPHK